MQVKGRSRFRERPGSNSNLNPTIPMSRIFLAIFLIVFGLNVTFGAGLPGWVLGLLALIAGVLILIERFGISVNKQP